MTDRADLLTGLEFGRDEIGNARRLAHYERNTLRYVKKRDQWFNWDGRRWNQSTPGDMMAVGRRVVAKILEEALLASEAGDPSPRKLHGAHAVKSHSRRAVGAMIDLATGDERLWCDESIFDTNPYLVNFVNCTVDVRDLRWHKHDPADLITKVIRHNYAPAKQAPGYLSLVARTFQAACRDQATCPFVHKLLGYAALVGRNFEQIIVLIVGDENSGKTKVVEIPTELLLPDYVHKSKPDLISRKRGGHHDSERFSIIGKRLVTISETSALFDLDEQVVKELTGDIRIPARALYRSTELNPLIEWTILVAVNEFPNVLEWDNAIKRRVVPLPAGPPIPEHEIVKDLDQRILATEAEGVLAWLVAGAHRWYLDWQGTLAHPEAAKTGLALPLNVELFKEEYAASQDHVGRFIEESLEVRADLSVAMRDVFTAFKRWRGTGEVSNRNKLYSRVRRLPGVTAHRSREFRGVGLRLPTAMELMMRADDATA
jgi:putative DNA primase/helicase